MIAYQVSLEIYGGFFYQGITLRTNDFGNEENIIMGGDFNCPLNINLDKKKGGIQVPRRHVVKCIEEIQDEFNLHDIWRIENPSQKSFTWARCSPFRPFYIL